MCDGGTEADHFNDHLCKPEFTHSPPESKEEVQNFIRWCSCILSCSRDPFVYMKLSGGFTEMATQDPSAPLSVIQNVEAMKPWLEYLLKSFQPDKVIFGSDWPVCNVGGLGNEQAWSAWVTTVEAILLMYDYSDNQRDAVWYSNAIQAYKLD
jgi:L-rhamnono-1,4-lactonase